MSRAVCLRGAGPLSATRPPTWAAARSAPQPSGDHQHRRPRSVHGRRASPRGQLPGRACGPCLGPAPTARRLSGVWGQDRCLPALELGLAGHIHCRGPQGCSRSCGRRPPAHPDFCPHQKHCFKKQILKMAKKIHVIKKHSGQNLEMGSPSTAGTWPAWRSPTAGTWYRRPSGGTRSGSAPGPGHGGPGGSALLFPVSGIGSQTESPRGSTLVQKPLRPQRGSHQPRSRPQSAGRGCRALQRWWPSQRRPRESSGGGGSVSKLRAVGLTSQSRPSLSSPFLCGGHRRPRGPRRPHSVLTGLGLATAHEARLLLGAGNQGICEGPHFSVKAEDWVTHTREACEHISTGTRTLSPHREPRERGLGASLKGGGCSRRERRVAATHPGGSRHSRGAQHGDGAGRGSSSRGPLVTPRPVQWRL